MILVRNCQLLAALSATSSQYSTTVLGGHSLTEAVLVYATAIVWLKCSLHCEYLFNFVIYLPIWGAKVLISFELRKFYTIFS